MLDLQQKVAVEPHLLAGMFLFWVPSRQDTLKSSRRPKYPRPHLYTCFYPLQFDLNEYAKLSFDFSTPDRGGREDFPICPHPPKKPTSANLRFSQTCISLVSQRPHFGLTDNFYLSIVVDFCSTTPHAFCLIKMSPTENTWKFLISYKPTKLMLLSGIYSVLFQLNKTTNQLIVPPLNFLPNHCTFTYAKHKIIKLQQLKQIKTYTNGKFIIQMC